MKLNSKSEWHSARLPCLQVEVGSKVEQEEYRGTRQPRRCLEPGTTAPVSNKRPGTGLQGTQHPEGAGARRKRARVDMDRRGGTTQGAESQGVGQHDQPDVMPNRVLMDGPEDKIVTVEGQKSQDVQPSVADSVLNPEIRGGEDRGQKIVPGHGPRVVGGPRTLRECWRFMSMDIRERGKSQGGGGVKKTTKV